MVSALCVSKGLSCCEEKYNDDVTVDSILWSRHDSELNDWEECGGTAVKSLYGEPSKWYGYIVGNDRVASEIAAGLSEIGNNPIPDHEQAQDIIQPADDNSISMIFM